MGGLGIAIHSEKLRDFAVKLGRTGAGVVKGQEFTDIDFMSYGKQRDKVKGFFRENGYAKRRATLSSAAPVDKYTIIRKDGYTLTFSSTSFWWQTTPSISKEDLNLTIRR